MIQRMILPKESVDKMNTKELILELFHQDRKAVYRGQDKIIAALEENFHVQRTQGAISKALTELSKRQFFYRGKDYRIYQTDKGYMLYQKKEALQDVIDSFVMKRVFKTFDIFTIHNRLVAYCVKRKHQEYVVESLRKVFLESSFFDIVSHGDKVYFLLNDVENLYEDMKYILNKVEKAVIEDDYQ